MTMDSDCWQYAPRAIKAGEIIEIKDWPHPSFFPMNFAPEKCSIFSGTDKNRACRSGHGMAIAFASTMA
jgi:hypothetical protein